MTSIPEERNIIVQRCIPKLIASLTGFNVSQIYSLLMQNIKIHVFFFSQKRKILNYAINLLGLTLNITDSCHVMLTK